MRASAAGPRALFIGGTGQISAACSWLAAERGFELSVLNRGCTALRPLPAGVRTLQADIRDRGSARAALAGDEFDVVVDFVAFSPDHVQADIELFTGRTRQYVFISSATAYAAPVNRLPIVESNPLRNKLQPYAQAKIACEDLLVRAYRDDGFPCTIVRPSHTYDQTHVPCESGWTVVERMRRGQAVVVHGDGTSLWTLTHHTDFARGLVGLLGQASAIGESFHVTSDEALSWNQIYEQLAAAAGAEARLVHVPSDLIFAADEAWGRSLLGHQAHSLVFDNSKLRRLVPDFAATTPFSHGVREIVAWHDEDPRRRRVDARMDALMDRLAEDFRPPRRRCGASD